MRPALGIAAYVLQILAFLCLGLALLPVLYPIVTSLGLAVFVSALAILGLYPLAEQRRRKPATGGALTGSVATPSTDAESSESPEPKRFSRDWIARRGTTRRAWRAARISLVAVLIVLGLYTVMRLHSRFYYEEPLNRELDPIREAFRMGHRPAEPANDNETESNKTAAEESNNTTPSTTE